eukprot:GDKK01034663.1.p4 GENE.GDKK01034663.1~~GDKK01034663.1.p4  ORF type:complete len:114 (+),score=8.19 GDKK01034663.1:434-775(+)
MFCCNTLTCSSFASITNTTILQLPTSPLLSVFDDLQQLERGVQQLGTADLQLGAEVKVHVAAVAQLVHQQVQALFAPTVLPAWTAHEGGPAHLCAEYVTDHGGGHARQKVTHH